MMSSQREPNSTIPVPSSAQPSMARLSVGQFAERFRSEVIPLSNTFGYFCASVPMTEEVVKEYLEEPVAALPSSVAAMLPHISILLVPYLERAGNRPTARRTAKANAMLERV